jgi:hypothetical protein
MVGLPRGIVTTAATIPVRLIAYRLFVFFRFLYPRCVRIELLEH